MDFLRKGGLNVVPSTRGAVRRPDAELLLHGQRTLGLLAVAGHLFGAQGREHIHLLVGERPQVPPSPPLGRAGRAPRLRLKLTASKRLRPFRTCHGAPTREVPQHQLVAARRHAAA